MYVNQWHHTQYFQRESEFSFVCLYNRLSRNIPWYRFYGIIKHITCFINVVSVQIDNKIKFQVNVTRTLIALKNLKFICTLKVNKMKTINANTPEANSYHSYQSRSLLKKKLVTAQVIWSIGIHSTLIR